ncbi:MAG TPA: hypothetical protein ENN11_04330 [Methanomicrobia archaeon]|nr:hypothetical protein [Methanomicrobia archaeon]
MITELDTIKLIRFLEQGETNKASDILSASHTPASPYEEGYKKALYGLVASIENNERDSLFYKLLHNEMDAGAAKILRSNVQGRLEQTFRDPSSLGYEHAWEFVLSYFSGEQKMGLDKYQN